MAADLHIHIRTPELTYEVMRLFFCNSLGSKWGPKSIFNCLSLSEEEKKAKSLGFKNHDEISKLVMNTDQIWVGEVSWLKASLFEDSDSFIPDFVQFIFDLISSNSVITQEMVELVKSWKGQNNTSYILKNKDDIVAFLERHLGEEAFVVSW